MLVNPDTKAAKLLKRMGPEPSFGDIVLEVEKRAELHRGAKNPEGPHVYQFTDGSQIELRLATNVARVVKNAD